MQSINNAGSMLHRPGGKRQEGVLHIACIVFVQQGEINIVIQTCMMPLCIAAIQLPSHHTLTAFLTQLKDVHSALILLVTCDICIHTSLYVPMHSAMITVLLALRRDVGSVATACCSCPPTCTSHLLWPQGVWVPESLLSMMWHSGKMWNSAGNKSCGKPLLASLFHILPHAQELILVSAHLEAREDNFHGSH